MANLSDYIVNIFIFASDNSVAAGIKYLYARLSKKGAGDLLSEKSGISLFYKPYTGRKTTWLGR